ncbi:hypothetical protein Hdeb2414_s0003g00083261 [Helianthus debilis subsp. tardiflorus]
MPPATKNPSPIHFEIRHSLHEHRITHILFGRRTTLVATATTRSSPLLVQTASTLARLFS